MDSSNPIVKLASSSKALVVAIAIIGVIVMDVLGRIGSKDALDFIKWIVMTWLAAQAAQDGANALASRPTAAGPGGSASVSVSNVAPPAPPNAS